MTVIRPHAERRRRRRRARAGWLALVLLVAGIVVAGIAGYFGRDPVHVFAAEGRARPIAALYMPGDMGLHFGPGPATIQGLAAQGIGLVVLNSPTIFRTRRTRAEVDAIVADGVARAIATAHGGRVMLIGQSYGADILQTGLAHLPAHLRAHVAGVVLVVPGETVFFRSDPSGLTYRGTPDSIAAATLGRLGWTPLTCIYGMRETDSACPHVHLPGARVIAMPGGHFLNNDRPALVAHILAAIRRAAPEAFR